MDHSLQIARRRALDPYIEQLRRWCLQGADAAREGTPAIDMEGSLWRNASMDREQLAGFFNSAEAADSDSTSVVPELVALLVKIASDIERVGSSIDLPAGQFYALQAELTLDRTLGTALLDELAAKIDAAASGRSDEAIRLGDVTERLRRAVADVNTMAAESERMRAALLAEADPPEAGPVGPRSREARPPAGGDGAGPGRAQPREARVVPTAADLSASDLESPEWVRFQTRRSHASRPALEAIRRYRKLRVRTMVLVLALSGVALLRMESLDASRGSGHVREVSVGHRELVQKVERLPPTLYIDVRPQRWNAIPVEERERIVEDVAESAARADYEGVLWRLTDGRTVAQWWIRRGSVLTDPESPR